MMDLFITNISFSLYKMLIDGLKSCELLLCFYQQFGLLFWWHPFTAEDPLVSKWCHAILSKICSDEEINSGLINIRWAKGEYIFIIGWTAIQRNNCNICNIWAGRYIECDDHAHLVSKAGSVISAKSPSLAFKWSDI